MHKISIYGVVRFDSMKNKWLETKKELMDFPLYCIFLIITAAMVLFRQTPHFHDFSTTHFHHLAE